MNTRYWASGFYLAYFGAIGALFPYLNLFYQEIGIDTTRIGVLAGLMPFTSLIAAPLWGGMADAFRLHRRLLPLAMLATVLPILILRASSTLATLSLAVVAFSVFLAPIIPLADHSVLTSLGSRRAQYGKLRLWGAVGFGVTAWGTGELIERWGIEVQFAVYIAFMLLGIVFARKLPAPRVQVSEPFWRGFRRFITDARWLGFLAAMFLAGLCLSILTNYFALYLKALGAGEGLIGLSVAVGNLSELPIFFFSSFMLRRLSARGVLCLSVLLLAVRALFYSMLADPLWAIAAQLLHGPTFSAMWAAGVSYTTDRTPPGLGASAQAVFGATVFGLASAIGALVGGRLYEIIGAVNVFRLAACVALFGLAVFGVSEFRTRLTPSEA